MIFYKKKYLYYIFLFFTSIYRHSLGQYHITGQITGLKHGECILAYNHYSGSLYPVDTAKIDLNGNINFFKKKSLDTGIYEIVLPSKSKLITLIISDEQNINFKVDTVDIISSIKIKGSKESQLFYQLQFYLKSNAQKISELKSKNTSPIEIKKLEEEQKKYYDFFLKKNKNTFLVEILKTASNPEIPSSIRTSQEEAFLYYKNHFWDSFSFSNKKLVKTPFLKQKLDTYFNELTIQREDSIIKSAEYLLNKAQNGSQKEYEEYIIRYITNKYENSTSMGTEGVFVYMVERYFLTKYINVVDTSTLTSLKEKVNILKPLLLNKVIPDIGVQNKENRLSFIHELKSNFNIILFYSPSCGHCKEGAPKLKQFYNNHKNENIEIMTIAIDGNEMDWNKFINEHQWHSFINGYGLVVSRTVNYSKEYDVSSTPTIYILDKNLKIIARRIGIDDIEPFYNIYRKQKIENIYSSQK